MCLQIFSQAKGEMLIWVGLCRGEAHVEDKLIQVTVA